MNTISSALISGYQTISNKYGVSAEPRVSDWPLMENSNKVLAISMLYILIVEFIGPTLMRNRKPYSLKAIIPMYNIVQIIGCAFLVYKLLEGKSLTSLAKCTAARNVPDDNILNGYWWTMNLKMLELVETVFFVMRKKQSQVSKLHVYHHTSTFLLMWVATKYGADQLVAFYIILNCLVHIFMYTYYTGTAIGSLKLVKLLTVVKKYLTIIQMVQFTIMLVHSIQGILTSCSMPKIFYALFIPNVTLVFYMFINFYRKSYQKMNKIKT